MSETPGDVRPRRIWSDEAGDADAPLVALIHGTMDRSTGMLRLSRRLDRRFRVLRYDRRGYGRSGPTSEDRADADHGAPDSRGPFDMTCQVADLVALLDGRRALLIGHSYGGNVALSTAMHVPHLVAGVAAYETPLSWQSWWPGDTAGAAARAKDATTAEAAERFMRRLVGDTTWDTLPARTRDIRRAEGPALVGELSDLQAHRPWEAERIHCPLVFGFGSLCAPHHRRGMHHLRDQFPHSQLFELEGCRHDAPTSHSQLFADTIVDALATASGEPWASRLHQ